MAEVSPFKKSHVSILKTPGEFPTWHVKIFSYITSFANFRNQLKPNLPDEEYNGQRQEFIFGFLIQIVEETDAFNKLEAMLNAPPPDLAQSKRGVQAWEAITTFFLKQAPIRLDVLHEELNQPQKEGEKASAYFTRIKNTAHKIVQAGDNVTDTTIKRRLFKLRPEYESEVTFLLLQQDALTVDQLVNLLTRICDNIEIKLGKKSVEDSKPNAFLGGASDAFGYQKPPRSYSSPGPAEVHQVLKAYLAGNQHLPSSLTSPIEAALNAATAAEHSQRTGNRDPASYQRWLQTAHCRH